MKRLLVLIVIVLAGCGVEPRVNCSSYNVDVVVQRSWGGTVLFVKCSRVAAPTKFSDFHVFQAWCKRNNHTYVILSGGAT